MTCASVGTPSFFLVKGEKEWRGRTGGEGEREGEGEMVGREGGEGRE
tara:strand:+ start:269 stop:409 length:141 start_codon:yes stop_codon:yes gene_type:complete